MCRFKTSARRQTKMNDKRALKKDANRVASEVVQKRTLLPTNTTLLLVEGPDDDRVYRSFLDEARCKTVLCDGKPNLIGAANILQGYTINGWLGIADADFSAFTGEQLPPNVLATDDHDLEIMVLNTSALSELLGRLFTETQRQNQMHSWIRSAKKCGILERQSAICT